MVVRVEFELVFRWTIVYLTAKRSSCWTTDNKFTAVLGNQFLRKRDSSVDVAFIAIYNWQ